MPRRLRPALMAMASLGLLASCSPAKLEPASEARVRELIRDELLRNPEILVEAQEALLVKQRLALITDMAKDNSLPRVGPSNADIVVYEFFDYRCPNCANAVKFVSDTLKSNKSVRFVFLEMPYMTQGSEIASRAALAVNMMSPDKYFALHEALMSTPGDLTNAAIDAAARKAGIDVANMRRAMASPAIDALLARVQDFAERGGVRGVPTFLINDQIIVGFDRDALNLALTAKK